MHKISVIFGTRPETIKFAPVIRLLRQDPAFSCHICVTAQHREMLDQALNIFNILPDADLDVMRPNQQLDRLTADLLTSIHAYLVRETPDMVLVQGDTTTTFCAALAAFYLRIPTGHLEAGLRTGNLSAPFPEEANRIMTSHLASLHLAPTAGARDNLLHEGIPAGRIHVTGNTVIDALLLGLEQSNRMRIRISGIPFDPGETGPARPTVMITGHRRESFGSGFESICRGIALSAERFREVEFVYPAHLNPNVREPVNRILKPHPNVHIIEPLPYLEFITLMERCRFILTDSGGIQEEAPSLGKPVLVMRDTTERPEAVASGAARLIGTSARSIFHHVSELLTSSEAYRAMTGIANPFGDGKASQRILKIILEYLDCHAG
ncbi:UDP-N-acetylglucosamine 2-epimerase (non-hydrolyzing) [bacterium]|nr:UDP-N-acetylglucosamine 2-epimerase (non-hydrolyzing) [candidate division CSSED10-310 bacterium]